VIPRHSNQGIVTSNFKLVCEGKVGTKVLEDEMYMSEIIMMSEDMDMKWYNFPLEQCPSLNIYWEYGVFYPMSRYFHPVISAPESSDDAEDAESQMRELKRLLNRHVCVVCVLIIRDSGFEV
jgi:hypothetical protein